ncbi:hypothetical protein E2C01_001268 [Portunus trituberculatus]|uniref:Uncharacterized protein n=1 Tax=Portunus trituberculatus TaxID=210409 RepID=A0A5B7CHD9_PORTR|nr:hypothetical protein [Portunus trituberculatus]
MVAVDHWKNKRRMAWTAGGRWWQRHSAPGCMSEKAPRSEAATSTGQDAAAKLYFLRTKESSKYNVKESDGSGGMKQVLERAQVSPPGRQIHALNNDKRSAQMCFIC